MAKDRSPNYPSLNLEEAIERITVIYRSEHTHPFAQIAAFNDLGYSGRSGRSLTQLGALRAYGLLEGRGDVLRVSKSAVSIVEFSGEPSNPTRIQALRDTAFAPTIFNEMHEQFGDRPPSDAAMRHWLVGKEYLSNAADEVIRTYRENLAFLHTAIAGYNDHDDDDIPPLLQDQKVAPGQKPAVGDYVQWESSGVLQFTEPRRVREISEDGGWAFVEGSNTGLPVKDLTVITETPPPSTSAPTPPRPRSFVEAQERAGDQPPASPDNLLKQTLVISIPRDFKVDIGIRGDTLRLEDLTKIKNQFNRWIEGLEEAFEE
jgi:hypothetical protein